MTYDKLATGPILPRAALAEQSGLIAHVAIFGAFTNLLILVGPIFALQVYDRVLGSRSTETLVTLTVLVAFLFILMAILDSTRKKIAARIGLRLVSGLETEVFRAVRYQRVHSHNCEPQGFADLDNLGKFFSSPVFVALFDILWFPVFFIGSLIFHPMLGLLTMLGAGAIFIPALWTLLRRQHPSATDRSRRHLALTNALIVRPKVDTVNVNFEAAVLPLWQRLRQELTQDGLSAQDRRTGSITAIQTFRSFLQSAVIALGAYLVLQNEISPGVIIASSVLLARALGPLDMVGQNAGIIREVIQSWQRLSQLIQSRPVDRHSSTTPTKIEGISINQVTAFPPDAKRAALQMVNFEIKPGEPVAVVGPSGAGKSALAFVMSGLWPVAGGEIVTREGRFLEDDAEMLARSIGYLPQKVRFFDGTISENICGLCAEECHVGIEDAARQAGVHAQIQGLPDGYETRIQPNGANLSGGMRQQIGLARTVFGNPDLLIFDEPINNLDVDGVAAFDELIQLAMLRKQQVLVISQRESALNRCTNILSLSKGRQEYFGPARNAVTHSSPSNADVARENAS